MCVWWASEPRGGLDYDIGSAPRPAVGSTRDNTHRGPRKRCEKMLKSHLQMFPFLEMEMYPRSEKKVDIPFFFLLGNVQKRPSTRKMEFWSHWVSIMRRRTALGHPTPSTTFWGADENRACARCHRTALLASWHMIWIFAVCVLRCCQHIIGPSGACARLRVPSWTKTLFPLQPVRPKGSHGNAPCASDDILRQRSRSQHQYRWPT